MESKKWWTHGASRGIYFLEWCFERPLLWRVRGGYLCKGCGVCLSIYTLYTSKVFNIKIQTCLFSDTSWCSQIFVQKMFNFWFFKNVKRLTSKLLVCPILWHFPLSQPVSKLTWRSCAHPQRVKCVHLIFDRLSLGARREKSSRTGNKAQRDLFGARAFAAAGRKVGEFAGPGLAGPGVRPRAAQMDTRH